MKRSVRLVRIAWALFFIAPVLLLEGYLLHGRVHFEYSKGIATSETVIWRLASLACVLGAIGCFVLFIAIVVRQDKPK